MTSSIDNCKDVDAMRWTLMISVEIIISKIIKAVAQTPIARQPK